MRVKINHFLTHTLIGLAITLNINEVSCQENVIREVSTLSRFQDLPHEDISRYQQKQGIKRKDANKLMDCQDSDDEDDDNVIGDEEVDRKRRILRKGTPCNMKTKDSNKDDLKIDSEAENKLEDMSYDEEEGKELGTSNSTDALMEVSDIDVLNNLHIHVRTRGPPTVQNCGGCTILWALHYAIKALNVSTTNNGSEGKKYKACPTDELLREPIASGKTIVIIYPEKDSYSCLGAGNRIHVRWMLSPLGINSPEDTSDGYGIDDLVFHYTSACASVDDLPVNNILQVIKSPEEGDQTDISPAVFFNQTGREGIMWMLRKAFPFRDTLEYIHEGHGMKTTQNEKPTVSELLKFKYFVSYDPFTFYIFIAAMSGTISIVNPTANLSKKEWALGTYVGEYLRSIGSENIPGVAYGWSESEIEYAEQTMPQLREFLFKAKEWSKTTIPVFLRDSYRYANGERNIFEGGILVHDAFPRYNNSNASKMANFLDTSPRDGYGRIGHAGEGGKGGRDDGMKGGRDDGKGEGDDGKGEGDDENKERGHSWSYQRHPNVFMVMQFWFLIYIIQLHQ